MNLRKVFAYIFLSSCVATGNAQVAAQLSLSEGTVTAGDSLKMTLSLDEPATCPTGVFVYFQMLGSQFTAGADIQPRQKVVVVTAELPRDLPAGQYRSVSGTFNPCPGYSRSKQFSVPATTVNVKSLPDPNQYPTRADLALSLTEKQFLDTKIAQLNSLDNKITTQLEVNRDDNPQNRDFLVSIVQSAQTALDVTEKQYREQIMKSKGTTPPFFADFHAQYRGLLVDLNAPIPGTAEAPANNAARLVDVQLELKKRPLSETGPSQNLSDTLPPSANEVSRVIRDNASAYNSVKEGRLTFEAELMSIPPGARIYYKKLIDTDYEDYSSPTDVSHATFDLATWKFKFHKDGCTDDQVVRVNPYEDTHPIVSVEFSHCRGR